MLENFLKTLIINLKIFMETKFSRAVAETQFIRRPAVTRNAA